MNLAFEPDRARNRRRRCISVQYRGESVGDGWRGWTS